jgi:hypothetical protein
MPFERSIAWGITISALALTLLCVLVGALFS